MDPIRFGTGFPHTIGTDPHLIRRFVQTVEQAGFDDLLVIEHVAGAHPDRLQGPIGGLPRAPYSHEDPFHEVFTLLGFIAALTTRIGLATNVLVLPQRQTVLAAKQAAEIDLLSRGRLTLGVGVGWNEREFEILDADFSNRGKRIEEQVAVLRQLWSSPLVTFDGQWHRLDRVGINPLPGRAIPIWMGSGHQDVSLRRIARLADGWVPLGQSDQQLAPSLVRLRRYLERAGRDPATFGLRLQIRVDDLRGDRDALLRRLDAHRAHGATHVTLNVGRPAPPLDRHLDLLIDARRLLLG
ncbi:MAG TPA: LLM class F420-dependent oxidoreductase [Chloroflexota bacterium]|nr:LLM class F420-dependent oxidoreductase [Chloroflexota bacterium]